MGELAGLDRQVEPLVVESVVDRLSKFDPTVCWNKNGFLGILTPMTPMLQTVLHLPSKPVP